MPMPDTTQTSPLLEQNHPPWIAFRHRVTYATMDCGDRRSSIYCSSNIWELTLHVVYSANILLGTHFEAKISDFGLAKVATGRSEGATGRFTHVTREEMSDVYGSRAYLPLDFVSSGCQYSVATDVFSFGVVSWILFSYSFYVLQLRLFQLVSSHRLFFFTSCRFLLFSGAFPAWQINSLRNYM